MDTNDDNKKEAINFLQTDFNQCFNQIRHYDSQVFDILKFSFTAYTTIIGVALGLYQFGIKEKIDFYLPSVFILITGFIIGLYMFSVSIRNRVYFVQVTRYINEQRRTFLQYQPLNFLNESRMYTNHLQPPYFNWRSSQSWFIYIIAFLNSLLLATLIYLIFITKSYLWLIVVLGFSLAISIQLILGIYYLISRENKSASKAVFGRD